MQGQCKPNAIELARIAEVQPVLAFFHDAKVRRFLHSCNKKTKLFAHTVKYLTCINTFNQSLICVNSPLGIALVGNCFAHFLQQIAGKDEVGEFLVRRLHNLTTYALP